MKTWGKFSVFFLLVCLTWEPAIAGSKSSSYPGVVALYTKDSSNNEFQFLGSAVFIEPDTLATAAHVFFKLSDEPGQSLDLRLWFFHPETKEFEPVTSYHTIDFYDDVALLKVNSPSKVFYPVEHKEKFSFSNHQKPPLIMAGFLHEEVIVIEGQALNQWYGDFIEGELYYVGLLNGLSGGAVFHAETGQLMGIVLSMRYRGFFRFVSVSAIKEHLSSQPQNCRSQDCLMGQLIEVLEQAFFEKLNADSAVIQHQAGLLMFGATCYRGPTDKSKNCRADVALALLLSSAKQNYIPAVLDYCLLKLHQSANVFVPKKEALDFCSFSAGRGDISAMSILGLKYYYGGPNVEINYNQAKYWLSKASEKGSVFARLHIGGMHAVGLGGLPKNLSLALCFWTSLPLAIHQLYPKVTKYIQEFQRLGYSCSKDTTD